MKSYSEMMQLESYEERLSYLKLLDNNVTSPRHMSTAFYKSHTWKSVRREIMNRDLGFDLGVFGVYIHGNVYVHHINPIDANDILNNSYQLTDPENLITVSGHTHNLIHYNQEERDEWVERTPGDTKLW